MAKILWLDDEPQSVHRAMVRLRNAGYEVESLASDEQLTRVLKTSPAPEVIIQDLFRPGYDRDDSSYTWEALRGWQLYEELLALRYPGIPVIICSMSAHEFHHRKKASDFNLTLLHKKDLEDTILGAVEAILRRQSPLFAAALAMPPAIVGVDFRKVNDSLVKHLARHPNDIHNVSWGTFEELVARLLQELGYDVHRTPLTRDGGVDIWAVWRSDLGEVIYAIDAKKYSPARLVGPEPVRAIHGVADATGSSVGMIVTTSYFSPAAITLANQFRYKISLQNFERVSSWIRKVSGDVAFGKEPPNPRLQRTANAKR